MSRPFQAPVTVAVVGGGLAGLAAALECADAGARVTLFERRNHLGGLTRSFPHSGHWVDNGQHVFLRCCNEYLRFLDRIGSSADVEMPARLDLPVVAPGARPGDPPQVAHLRRSDLPPPLHLLRSLMGYPHLTVQERLGLGRALIGLKRLGAEDPDLDAESFGSWLARHGQSASAVAALWDLITVPTVNLPAAEASLAMGAKVFRTALLETAGAADIGWSRVPLARLHGERSARALARSGVEVRLGVQVTNVEPGAGSAARQIQVDAGSEAEIGYMIRTAGGSFPVDGVIVAVPHREAAGLLPPGTLAGQDRLDRLGSSAIVDVHLVFDRPVTNWPLMAAVRSPVQWVFDRTASSGMGERGGRGAQYLAVSLSAADRLLGCHPDSLVPTITSALIRLLPAAGDAHLIDTLVTKERHATFRAVPGTAGLRPKPATARRGLAVAGAWTDTGWPATMEGAVRSGRAAARACLAGSFPPVRPGPRLLGQPIEEVA